MVLLIALNYAWIQIAFNREWIQRCRHFERYEFFRRIRSVFGVSVAALIIAVVNNGLTLLNVSSHWQLAIKRGVLILAVTLDKLRTHGQAT
jgi:hypothetical protein